MIPDSRKTNKTPQEKKQSQPIKQIQRGDADAFQQLFDEYSSLLIKFVFRYVNDMSAAENIVQDIFLHIWINRVRLNPQSSIKAYLFTAARNRALKYVRHADVHRRSENKLQRIQYRVQTPEDEWNRKEIECAVEQAIAELPEKSRLIFSMNRFDQLTYSEIAEVLNISIKTVETHIGRTLKFLRNRLSYLLTASLI